MFHKKKPANIITIIFALLIIGQTSAFLLMNINEPTQAWTIEDSKNPLDNLQVEIPGLKDLAQKHPATCDGKKCYIPWIGIYISAVYRYAIGSVGILATVVLMFSGALWITAAGNSEQISKAKAYMASSLTGMILAVSSYFILFQINPDLLEFKPIEVAMVQPENVYLGEAGPTCSADDGRNFSDISNQAQDLDNKINAYDNIYQNIGASMPLPGSITHNIDLIKEKAGKGQQLAQKIQEAETVAEHYWDDFITLDKEASAANQEYIEKTKELSTRDIPEPPERMRQLNTQVDEALKTAYMEQKKLDKLTAEMEALKEDVDKTVKEIGPQLRSAIKDDFENINDPELVSSLEEINKMTEKITEELEIKTVCIKQNSEIEKTQQKCVEGERCEYGNDVLGICKNNECVIANVQLFGCCEAYDSCTMRTKNECLNMCGESCWVGYVYRCSGIRCERN